MSLPICYLICGFLGAGKTTYSQKLSKETGAIHLNPDEWCMKLFSKEEYAQKGKSIIFDMGFWTKQSRDEATYYRPSPKYSQIYHSRTCEFGVNNVE